MARHSPSKTGVNAPFDPAVHAVSVAQKDVDARVKSAHDGRNISDLRRFRRRIAPATGTEAQGLTLVSIRRFA
jgi:hypothetical protein